MRKRRRKFEEIPSHFPLPACLSARELDDVISIYKQILEKNGTSEDSLSVWNSCIDFYVIASLHGDDNVDYKVESAEEIANSIIKCLS